MSNPSDGISHPAQGCITEFRSGSNDERPASTVANHPIHVTVAAGVIYALGRRSVTELSIGQPPLTEREIDLAAPADGLIGAGLWSGFLVVADSRGDVVSADAAVQARDTVPLRAGRPACGA